MSNNFDGNKGLLEKYAAGDEKAAEKLISDNMGLIKSIALRFMGRGQELEDLDRHYRYAQSDPWL